MTLRDDVMVMLEEELYLAVPTHSDFGRKTAIRLAGSRPIRQITNSYFEEEGFSPHIVFESDTTESVRNLIAAGMGIGFWPQHSWGTIP
ncbi:MAG: LysR family transcriptional regulator substrate-binding protein [Clostridium sp.]